ncbi:acetyltransferase [Brevundimonas sp.]|uniref:acetyltransferase n=1 Tax=Brevundimonas sp. TaxID=1871086 RepID=UPI0035B34922
MQEDTTLVWLGLFGAGGHAREMVESALRVAEQTPGLAPDRVVLVDRAGSGPVSGVAVLSEQEFASRPGRRLFVTAVGDGRLRRKLDAAARATGAEPVSVIDPSARVSPDAGVRAGALISPFALISAGAVVGEGFQANYYAHVSHDCRIGDWVTLGPKAGVNGHVEIGDNVTIGAGAIIRNGGPDRPLRIGRDAVIGMGAVVIADVPEGATVMGNPARVRANS